MSVAAGDECRVAYPFVRVQYTEGGYDIEGPGPQPVDSWAPGTRMENVPPDGCEAVADAMGEMFLTVVSVHKPGRYPTRVFFTRKWRRPDGVEFGKVKLHIATLEKFNRLARGYQHEFTVRAAGGES